MTHYFSFPLLGLSVLTGMLKSQDKYRCPVAVLIDPSIVGQSEFETVHQTFGTAGYYLRAAFGKNATAQSAAYLTEYLPCDFIFYSTHCGEVKGQRVIERFPDKNGKLHIICYDRVLSGFRTPLNDLFEIKIMKSWVSLDDVSWYNEEMKKAVGAGELLTRRSRNQEDGADWQVWKRPVKFPRLPIQVH
jgi:hypothetical protein